MGRTRGSAYLHALLITGFVLALFYYWFAVADRYHIFLYNHLGATPFDERTRSRYWMAGLVAAGAVMVLDSLANWLLGRLAGIFYRRYEPPGWPWLWLGAALPVAGGILFITMRYNQPTLPLPLAGACVLATLCGLGVALAAGGLAAQQLGELIWCGAFGVGFMPVLLLLRAVELPQRGLVPAQWAYLFAGGGLAASVVMLAGLAILRRRRKLPPIPALVLLAAGVGVAYLLLPLAHYLFFVPAAYRYISTASNFFAFDRNVQLVVFVIAGLLAWVTTRLQQIPSHLRSKHESA
jgi:hypothetical protein